MVNIKKLIHLYITLLTLYIR